MKLSRIALLTLVVRAAIAAPAPDPLGRDNPRSSVTGFLEASQSGDYQRAAQYLDLRQTAADYREKHGPELAKQLEAILNSDTRFNVLHLSRNPDGDRAPVTTISQDGRNLTLDLQRVALQDNGPMVWLFSSDTVAAIPHIRVSTISSAVEKFLPPFLVSQKFLETSLWKWIVLALLALLMLSLSRLLDRLLALVIKFITSRFSWQSEVPWIATVVQPLRVMLCLAVFRIGIGIIDPSAIARLYVGRAMEIIFVWSIAWCLVRLVKLFMEHLERRMDTPQQMASRSMLRLGQRTLSATIAILAILVILQNWGYNTSTLIAGLGVGGIAVALAAQQTIANIFGGVSIIGDQPVRVGEFGKFGDIQGTVEDIGMRSTRVRTLNRTVVSVPNSNFAGFNLENFAMRDKILFNPTFQIKRTTADEKVRSLIESLNRLFAGQNNLEPVPTPARIVALSSGAYSLEIFCYVKTPNIDEFYKIQSELLLRINDLLTSAQVELA